MARVHAFASFFWQNLPFVPAKVEETQLCSEGHSPSSMQ